MKSRRRFWLLVAAHAAFALAAALASPLFGAERVNLIAALHEWLTAPPGQAGAAADIVVNLRLPRIVMAFMAGASLAVTGAAFQAMLRNPLATPYTLGVAGGGSFGAVLAIFLPAIAPGFPGAIGPVPVLQLFAFLGCLLAVGMIYMLARSRGRLGMMELLLAGVTMGMIFSALILLVRYFAQPQMLVDMDRWLMGRLDVVGWGQLKWAAAMLAPALCVILAFARQFDMVALGEALAAGRGVDVARLQRWTFFAGSLATAAVVAVVGPIAFVGLIVPHVVRRVTGPDHRLMLLCTLFAGGGFLIVCDTIGRTVIPPQGLPVGVITALLGGPFFIGLLVRRRRGGWF